MNEDRVFLVISDAPDGGKTAWASSIQPDPEAGQIILRMRGRLPQNGVTFPIPAPFVPQRSIVMRGVSLATGRAVFTFDPPFDVVPTVSAPKLMFAAASGCACFQVGEATKTSVTFEVRKMKTLAVDLVGIAHEPAANVTVEITATA